MARILGRFGFEVVVIEYVTNALRRREKSSSGVHDVALTINFRLPDLSSLAYVTVSEMRDRHDDLWSGDRG